jgi:hypothetical protein
MVLLNIGYCIININDCSTILAVRDNVSWLDNHAMQWFLVERVVVEERRQLLPG